MPSGPSGLSSDSHGPSSRPAPSVSTRGGFVATLLPQNIALLQRALRTVLRAAIVPHAGSHTGRWRWRFGIVAMAMLVKQPSLPSTLRLMCQHRSRFVAKVGLRDAIRCGALNGTHRSAPASCKTVRQTFGKRRTPRMLRAEATTRGQPDCPARLLLFGGCVEPPPDHVPWACHSRGCLGPFMRA